MQLHDSFPLWSILQFHYNFKSRLDLIIIFSMCVVNFFLTVEELAKRN